MTQAKRGSVITAADVVDETFCCPLIGLYPCERERRGCSCHELHLINQHDIEGRAAALEGEPRPLKEFARWVLHEIAWSSCDVDGGDVQDKAANLGLIIKTEYDPKKHGESDWCEPGDDWYVFGPLIADM